MGLSVGTKLGTYEVLAPIGAGGMGEVYRARDTTLGRDVALKVMPDEFTADADRLARFRREAQVLAALNHPNIAAIYGVEQNALVLELVEGPTLADRIQKGPIPVDEALPIAHQIAEALEAAHEAGVIHRDLKPANVKVKEDGTVKVLDFGLAKALAADDREGDPSESPTLTTAATRAGVIMGTAAYMSPEQAKGKRVDRRADIWGFGAVLYEMLTGRRPFAGEDVSETLAFVLTKEPDWPALPKNVPPALRTFMMRCLEKDPRQRVRDAGDLRLALAGAFETASKAAEPVAAKYRALPWAVAVVASLLTGLVTWSLTLPGPPEVTRFAYELPAGQQLRSTGRPVLAVSPDGRRFVYNTAEGLYLRSMDELGARLLPGTEESIIGVFFSPDGQSVLYRQGGQLKRLAVSGGAPVIVCSSAGSFGAQWAPDGTIFFAREEGILRVSANGGTPELVVPSTGEERYDAPLLLPDGDTLLVSVATGSRRATYAWDNAEIVAVSLSSGERKVLLKGGSDGRYLPSGHLVYAFEDGLFAVGFDVQDLRVTGGPVSMVEGVYRPSVTASGNYSISEDSTLYYLAGAATTKQRLSWVDRDGRAERIETIPPGFYASPRLSPDGERVLAVSDGDLRIYDLASGRESRLTTDGAAMAYAGWTPSGDEVTFTSDRGSNGPDVWIQPADGSGAAQQLTALEGEAHFDDWAPDGRTFSAHHHGIGFTTSQLMVPFDGKEAEPEEWLQREYANESAVFSPDGRYVALVTTQTGQYEIVIHPFPGPGGQTPVSVGGGVEPAWSRNGELFYRRLGDYAMMVVEVSTDPELTVGPPKELFRGRGFPGGSPRARYAVTADGQRFLMSAGLLESMEGGVGEGGRSQVVIVQNWIEELKARVPN